MILKEAYQLSFLMENKSLPKWFISFNSVTNDQDSMVEHDGGAKDFPWMGDAMPIKLEGTRVNSCKKYDLVI